MILFSPVIYNDTVFRWNSLIVDGHDISALCQKFHEAEMVKDRPTVILARTFKGRDVPGTVTVRFRKLLTDSLRSSF